MLGDQLYDACHNYNLVNMAVLRASSLHLQYSSHISWMTRHHIAITIKRPNAESGIAMSTINQSYAVTDLPLSYFTRCPNSLLHIGLRQDLLELFIGWISQGQFAQNCCVDSNYTTVDTY